MSALFPLKKRTSLRTILQDRRLQGHKIKEPGHSYIRALFDKKNLDIAKSKLFSTKNPGIRSGAFRQRIGIPSKNAHHSEDFFKTDDFKTTRQKEPKHNYIRALFDKEPRYMLGRLSTKIQDDFKKRPSSSLCQTVRGSRATSKWEYFFLQKGTHHAKISRSATRFRSKSTRTTLVPARRDLKEQDEASKTQ